MESRLPSSPPASRWEDLDSDEIASVTSEDLYENRPNRWTGSKSTWRDLTAEERMLWRSMQQVVGQDLAVHLYDAFAMKRHDMNPMTAQGLSVRTDDGQNTIWAPPKAWTAWPLKEKQVPHEVLFKEENDGNEAFTLRKKENKLPSAELQDELGATILRLAKERYRRRQHKARLYSVKPSIEAPSSPVQTKFEDSASHSSLPSSPPSMESAEEDDSSLADDEDDDSDSKDNNSCSETETHSKGYNAEISTDDHLSYQLLRPSVRHIITKLDRVLTILHNARIAGLSHLSDSDSSTEEDSDPNTPRKRGRPRKTRQPSSPCHPSSSGPSPQRRGRPRKLHTRLNGETEGEMQYRIARESHRRLPLTEKDKEAAFEAWLQQGNVRMERQTQQPQTHQSSQANIERKLRRWGLRDWSDVIGAAALAGFPPQVIARSTQRCANLFNQGMVVRSLEEQPSSRPGFTTTEYRPEQVRLSANLSSDSDTDSSEAILHQRRIASRQASLAWSRSGISSASSPASSRGRRRTQSPRQSIPQSRSRSRSSAGLFFCPLQTCDRAANGFGRRANLKRHMHLVHPGYAEDEDESDDEVVGAVHVDGFLKTINQGRGWRGEDVLARKRKRFYGQGNQHQDSE